MEGKTFRAESLPLMQLEQTAGVQLISKVLEENVLLKYGEKQYIATIKGVDDNYTGITGLDTMLVDGEFKLSEKGMDIGDWINCLPYDQEFEMRELL